MSLIDKEAKVCEYLNRYLKKKVKELLSECDSNWLIHDVKTFQIARRNDKEGFFVTVYPKIEIKSILFNDNDIYFVPKFVDQKEVDKYIKQINKEYKRIVQEYNEYISLINSNIKTLEVLLEI